MIKIIVNDEEDPGVPTPRNDSPSAMLTKDSQPAVDRQSPQEGFAAGRRTTRLKRKRQANR